MLVSSRENGGHSGCGVTVGADLALFPIGKQWLAVVLGLFHQ
jgi:hypothetical protein